MSESVRAVTRLLKTDACSSDAAAPTRSRDPNQWFLAERTETSSVLTELWGRAIGFLIISLCLVWSCSGMRLYNLVWKLWNNVVLSILYNTKSKTGSQRLLWGLECLQQGKFKTKLSRCNSKTGNVKSLDLTVNKSHFAVTVTTNFNQWNCYVTQQSESIVLQSVAHFVAERYLNTWH